MGLGTITSQDVSGPILSRYVCTITYQARYEYQYFLGVSANTSQVCIPLLPRVWVPILSNTWYTQYREKLCRHFRIVQKKSAESSELCEKVRKIAESAEMCGEWQIVRKCADNGNSAIPHPSHLGLAPAGVWLRDIVDCILYRPSHHYLTTCCTLYDGSATW